MEIAAASDRRVSELPYGEQRLLEIAIALSVRPRVLLLDVREATTAISVHTRFISCATIAHRARDGAVLLRAEYRRAGAL